MKDAVTHHGTVLVTDDEPAMRLALREVLRRNGWDVALAANADEALRLLETQPAPQLMMTDFRMPGMTGLELMREARRRHPQLPMIMMTAYGTIEDAVAAMREGASDYLLKPFSMETVVEVVRRALDRSVAETAAEASPSGTREEPPVAESEAMRRVLRIVSAVADADATVLLSGESGTGKEVVARELHRASGRRGPFVAVNCAALPEGLLESELFGHEKGAFTGALLSRKGRFEQAQGGTLLLDEISEMPLALQAKLLRVLQEKEVTPVGSAETVRLDVRVVATTNRNLRQAVEDGTFRQDLFYRLNVIAIELPPLRERPEDIVPLAQAMLRRHSRPGRPACRFSPDALRHLVSMSWPGNVRELENTIERACLLARGPEITVADLHPDLLGAKWTDVASSPSRRTIELENTASTAESMDFGAIEAGEPDDEPVTLQEMERRMILRTLARTGGNRTRTADLLGVSVRTIRNKLHEYGIKETLAAAR